MKLKRVVETRGKKARGKVKKLPGKRNIRESSGRGKLFSKRDDFAVSIHKAELEMQNDELKKLFCVS